MISAEKYEELRDRVRRLEDRVKIEVTVHSARELTEWLQEHYPNDDWDGDEVVIHLVYE